MPPEKMDLDQYREEISLLREAGTPFDAIVQHLRTEYALNLNSKTLRRRWQEWDNVPRAKTQDTLDLRARITKLCFAHNYSDQELLQALQKEGFTVTISGIVRIRKDLGIQRRRNKEQTEHSKEQARQLLLEQKEIDNVAETCGLRSLSTYVRKHGVNIGRATLAEVQHEIYPDAIARRKAKVEYRRTGWRPPGPNFIWSIDGYCKLQKFRFEICGSIDAYSRFVTWFYVGISATTSRSILQQYLRVVEQYGFIPLIIRADRGKETGLAAGAHYWLSLDRPPRHQANLPLSSSGEGNRDRNRDVQSSSDINEPISFNDCWVYGKSTHNVAIERWWLQLSERRAAWWLVSIAFLHLLPFRLTHITNFFESLVGEGLYRYDDLADGIALIYIYMPRLRSEFSNFVELWNDHYIRRQKRRPHVVPGYPRKLFTMPENTGAQDYRVSYSEERLRELKHILEYDPIDIDQYLPQETMQVCDAIIESLGGIPNRQIGPEIQRPLVHQYNGLRIRLRQHIDNRLLPAVSYLPSPTGGLGELKRLARARGVEIDPPHQRAEARETDEDYNYDEGDDDGSQ